MTELSIVIPSWNTTDLLRACLASVVAADKPETEIIVVDNGSADGSPDMVEREFPEVLLVKNDENRGFAGGCNQGMELARGDYVLLLNSDTELRGSVLPRLVDFLREHPDYAAAAPKLVNPDGSTQRACKRFPSLATALFFGTPLERWWPESPELRRYFMLDWDHEGERDLEQPPAACLLLSRRTLDRVGVFDEDLWLFYNDVDLSRRIARTGLKTRYLSDVEVLHHEGASTKNFEGFLPVWQENRLAYYRKHHGLLAGPWVKACVAFTLAGHAVAQGWAAVRGRPVEPVRPFVTMFLTFLRQ